MFTFSSVAVLDDDIEVTEIGVEGDTRRHEHKIDIWQDHFIGIAAGVIAIAMLMLFVIVLIVMRGRRRRKCDSKGHLVDSQQVTVHLNDLRVLSTSGSKLSNGMVYNSLQTGDEDALFMTDRPYREPCDALTGRKLPDLPITPASTGRHMMKVAKVLIGFKFLYTLTINLSLFTLPFSNAFVYCILLPQ